MSWMVAGPPTIARLTFWAEVHHNARALEIFDWAINPHALSPHAYSVPGDAKG